MSPDRHLPRWARVTGRALCVATYVLTAVVAVADALVPSTTIAGAVPGVQTLVSSWVLGALSLVGLGGVVAHRWRVEWVAATAITFFLLARAVVVWASVDDVPTRLAAAAMMTLGALCVGKRALDLWVFAETTARVAQTHARIVGRRRG